VLIHACHAAEKERFAGQRGRPSGSVAAGAGRPTPAKIVASRINELQSQVKALNAHIAELEAKLGGPPMPPDNSSLPPSRG
jgi:hypothetical protein